MQASEVISRLHQRGITLKAVSGNLKIRGAEKLSDRERASLKAHRGAILKALTDGLDNPIAAAKQAPVAGATAPTKPSRRAILNRQAMPQIAAAVDQLRVVFGSVRVIFAEEGDLRLGTAPATSGEGRP